MSDQDDYVFEAEPTERPQRGAMEADSVPTPADVKAAARKSQRTAKAALSMAIAGASDVEIASQLDYATPGAARAAWEKELGDAYDTTMDFKAFRNLQGARYSALLRSFAPNALASTIEVDDPDLPGQKKRVPNDLHLAYGVQFRNTLDRISTLHGLNAPQVIAHVTPDVATFERVVAEIIESNRSGEAPEGDPFAELEGEVVEDGDEEA